MFNASLAPSFESFHECYFRVSASAAKHTVVRNQEHKSRDRRHEYAITIHTLRFTFAEQISQKTTEDRADNTQENITNQTMTRLVDNLATNETD